MAELNLDTHCPDCGHRWDAHTGEMINWRRECGLCTCSVDVRKWPQVCWENTSKSLEDYVVVLGSELYPPCSICGVAKQFHSISNHEFTPYDAVNHPQHYGGDTTYETIKVIEAWGLNFHLGNVIKYISRYGTEDNVEDLEKARWYLTREIDRRTREVTKND